MARNSTFTASSPAGYEQIMGRWSRLLAPKFLDFAGSGSGERVLDAGCGTGSLTFELIRRADCRIEAVDLSEAYIRHAAGHSADPRVNFATADICALPFADAVFDRVLSLLVLHFVPDTAKAMAELVRVAKPGATVAATVWDARGGFVANRIFYDTAAVLDPAGVTRRARNLTRPTTRPGELAAAFRAAGLRDVREVELTIRMTFSAFDDYWAPYLGSDGPGADYVATLSPDMKQGLHDAVRSAYLDGEDDGPRSYAAIAWAAAGIVG